MGKFSLLLLAGYIAIMVIGPASAFGEDSKGPPDEEISQLMQPQEAPFFPEAVVYSVFPNADANSAGDNSAETNAQSQAFVNPLAE